MIKFNQYWIFHLFPHEKFLPIEKCTLELNNTTGKCLKCMFNVHSSKIRKDKLVKIVDDHYHSSEKENSDIFSTTILLFPEYKIKHISYFKIF